MKRVSRYFAVILALVVVFSMAAPVQAASKKNVYVCTKATVKDYTDDTYGSFKFSYKKNGLLKQTTYSIDGWYTGKDKYSYNGKSQIKKANIRTYLFGSLYSKGKAKFTYTKKGYVKKIVVYNGKGKKTSTTKLTRNKRGYVTTEKEYNGKGKLTSTTKYTVNKSGKITKIRKYNAKGKLTSTTYHRIKGNTITAKKYNAKGKLIETSVAKFKNGNLMSETTYDETNDHATKMVEKYTYKKVKTSKSSKVKKQQRDLLHFIQ